MKLALAAMAIAVSGCASQPATAPTPPLPTDARPVGQSQLAPKVAATCIARNGRTVRGRRSISNTSLPTTRPSTSTLRGSSRPAARGPSSVRPLAAPARLWDSAVQSPRSAVLSANARDAGLLRDPNASDYRPCAKRDRSAPGRVPRKHRMIGASCHLACCACPELGERTLPGDSDPRMDGVCPPRRDAGVATRGSTPIVGAARHHAQAASGAQWRCSPRRIST